MPAPRVATRSAGGEARHGRVAGGADATAAQHDASVATRLSALGVTFAPPDDTRYRSIYEDSVALRNRLFGN